jgi:hypothetical protein
VGWKARFLIVPVIALLLPASIAAQQEFATAESPFQGEFEYSIGDQLRPQIAIANLHWLGLRIYIKSGKEPESGKQITTTIELQFENPTEDALRASAVILFEDRIGNSLLRHSCRTIRVGAGKEKLGREKVKIQGDLLLATEKVYFYCEVE